MVDLLAISINMAIFVIIIVIFAKDKDYAAYGLLFALVAFGFSVAYFGIPMASYPGYVELSPLVFIIFSQLMVMLADEKGLFQYIAIKAVHATKAKPRQFLYMISFISSLIAAIVPDVMVALVFIPLVIRVSKVLKIDPKPYMYAVTICMNIGACLLPLNPTNFIIAVAFNKSPLWFFQNTIIMYLVNVFLTTFFLDLFYLRKQPTPDDSWRQMVMDLLKTDMLRESPQEKRSFSINFAIFFIAVGFFFVIPQMELVSIAAAIALSLANKKSMEKSFEKVDWKIIFFLCAMFIMIGTLKLAGAFDLIGTTLGGFLEDNTIAVALFVVFIASLFSAFLDNTPVVLMIIPILNNLFGVFPDLLAKSSVLIFALIAAVNMGGNLLPQGTAGDLMTLNQAKKNDVHDFTYKSLAKVGGSAALMHIGITILLILFMPFA
nr:SLC13 family permease [Candidatus Sigynarchaeota archaeon]